MDHPIDFDHVPDSNARFAAHDSPLAETWGAEAESAAFYQEIAERRAHLECAETLRRVRAL
ncbi:MAG TPA: hypothetical protein VE309_13470 [Caulobacteraceae bacterium]|jgi:hypothetical protein|nr:hypothetical protein [Caulobacteraceae bacterium]